MSLLSAESAETGSSTRIAIQAQYSRRRDAVTSEVYRGIDSLTDVASPHPRSMLDAVDRTVELVIGNAGSADSEELHADIVEVRGQEEYGLQEMDGVMSILELDGDLS